MLRARIYTHASAFGEEAETSLAVYCRTRVGRIYIYIIYISIAQPEKERGARER